MIPSPSPSFCWWYLPSWLGLDAPFVVTTWTWATSRAAEQSFPLRPAIAMFLTAWAIYLADRLIDVARCSDWTHATGRLRFGREYRPLFAICLVGCLLGLVAIVVLGLPWDVVQRGSFVALGVSLYCLIFVTPILASKKLPGKEFGVGLFFALGAFACLGVTHQNIFLLASIAVLVAFNCLVIAARDAEIDRLIDPGGASTWWRTLNRDLTIVGIFLTALSVASAFAIDRHFAISATTSFALLTLLHVRAGRCSGDGVRALADFAILTPLATLACQRIA